MKRFLMILAAVLVANSALAAVSDVLVTADGDVSLDGFSSAEMLADGSATVYLYDSSDTLVATYYLRDGMVRTPRWSYDDDVSYATVDLVTATEVVVTRK